MATSSHLWAGGIELSISEDLDSAANYPEAFRTINYLLGANSVPPSAFTDQLVTKMLKAKCIKDAESLYTMLYAIQQATAALDVNERDIAGVSSDPGKWQFYAKIINAATLKNRVEPPKLPYYVLALNFIVEEASRKKDKKTYFYHLLPRQPARTLTDTMETIFRSLEKEQILNNGPHLAAIWRLLHLFLVSFQDSGERENVFMAARDNFTALPYQTQQLVLQAVSPLVKIQFLHFILEQAPKAERSKAQTVENAHNVIHHITNWNEALSNLVYYYLRLRPWKEEKRNVARAKGKYRAPYKGGEYRAPYKGGDDELPEQSPTLLFLSAIYHVVHSLLVLAREDSFKNTKTERSEESAYTAVPMAVDSGADLDPNTRVTGALLNSEWSQFESGVSKLVQNSTILTPAEKIEAALFLKMAERELCQLATLIS